jgi:hypothetical protein
LAMTMRTAAGYRPHVTPATPRRDRISGPVYAAR